MRAIKIRSIVHNKKRPIVRRRFSTPCSNLAKMLVSLLAMAGILWWLHWG